jgi:hypothetical protein
MANTLGEELSDSLSNITALIVKTDSKSERTRLLKQQAQIAGQLQVFVDEVVDDALPEYEAAAQALSEANAEAEAAKKKLDKVASTIKKFASAIDKLAALAAKVAA